MDFVGSSLPLSQDGLQRCTTLLGVGEAAIWTLLSVETKSCGFLPDRRPLILFERHIFHKQTDGAFDASHPATSSPTPGGYEGGAKEYDRLAQAIALNREAALNSASWGIGQVMGFNSKLAGFATVESMVEAMQSGEDGQLTAVASFLKGRRLHLALAARDWPRFAAGYNGPDFHKNQYDTRLSATFAAYSTGTTPNIKVRQAQVILMMLGRDVGSIDGILGKRTRSAAADFRIQRGLPPSDVIDEPLISALIQQLKSH